MLDIYAKLYGYLHLCQKPGFLERQKPGFVFSSLLE